MNQRSDVQLIELQAATLFVCDPNGRLQSIREPGYAEWERDPANDRAAVETTSFYVSPSSFLRGYTRQYREPSPSRLSKSLLNNVRRRWATSLPVCGHKISLTCFSV